MANTVHTGRLDWTKININRRNNYCCDADLLLKGINVHAYDAFLCGDSNDHANYVCNTYDGIVKCLCDASESLYHCNNKVHNTRPGWNEHVSELHSAAREDHLRWFEAGKNRPGRLFELKMRANARFKYALRFIKNNEKAMRADSVARKLQGKSYYEFWKK